MNFKALSAACLLTVLSAGALPAFAQGVSAASHVTNETYTYGTQLDIDRVLSVSEDSSHSCGVVSAQMVYLDSMGDKRALTYSKLADACNSGN